MSIFSKSNDVIIEKLNGAAAFLSAILILAAIVVAV